MPGMGGTRCLDELKSRDPNLKVIMMSGYPLQGSLAQLKKNADGYLAKPVRAIQIIKAVQKAL
jgi:CheY-like chemotaxis protein